MEVIWNQPLDCGMCPAIEDVACCQQCMKDSRKKATVISWGGGSSGNRVIILVDGAFKNVHLSEIRPITP